MSPPTRPASETLCPKYPLWTKLTPPQACPFHPYHQVLSQNPGSPMICPFFPHCPHPHPFNPSPVNLVSFNPFFQPLLSPPHASSWHLTWTNKASQIVFCSLLLIPIHLVGISCLKPFHWFSLHLEIKSKLLEWPCISCPFYLSILSPTALSLTCQLPTTAS